MTQDQIMALIDTFAEAETSFWFGLDEVGTKFDTDARRNRDDARAAVVAAIEALTKDARLGAYVAHVAVNHGWSTNEPEDAYSFMMRRCREVAIDDCGKNAERYQWLRMNLDDSIVMYGDTSEAQLMGEEDLDAAIDAAMKEQV